MKAQTILITALTLLTTAWCFGQDTAQNKARNNFNLENPDVVRVEILPRSLESSEAPSVLTEPYKKGDKIYFRLQMTNTSDLPVKVFVTDFYFQNRPALYKDGELVSYLKGLSEVLEAKDKEWPTSHSGTVGLKAGESKVLGFINLRDWYDVLETGHYQLSVKHRFEPGQPWIAASNSVTFEVTPPEQQRENR